MFRALLDLGDDRIKAMDEDGIAMQVCVLAGSGIQDIDPVQGNELAALANDRLAETSRKYPGRITGLAAFAPRDPERAARELERAVKTLGLKGGIINSHSLGEYLDDKKFWPIFEAVQAMDVPIYIHPRDPSPQMIEPFEVFGFKVGWSWAAEVGTHVIRLIGNGVFDQFPRLQDRHRPYGRGHAVPSRPHRQPLFLGARDGGRPRRSSSASRATISATTSSSPPAA